MIFFLCSGLYSSSYGQALTNQISSIEEQVFKDRTEALIKGYFDNLTTIGKLDEEKDIFIGEFIASTFENDKVRVYNDIDITGSTQTDFDIATYLGNISLFYSNSEVDFEIGRMNLSKIFYSSDYYFIKVEVLRNMKIQSTQKSKIDSASLDIYVKFVPFKSNPRIYSIKKHESNSNMFKTVLVLAAEKNESINNDEVMFKNQAAVSEIKPGQFYLTSLPEGANIVFLDYPDFGKIITPKTITYPATKYNIRLSKNEYETLDTVINIGIEKSKSFTLVPTFAYLNLEITPENADVLVNGEKVLFLNGNDFDAKVPKGKSIVEISAEHYYPKRMEIETKAGLVFTIQEALTPKNGTISLTADNSDAVNATISIDNIKVGTLPLTNFVLLEGKHTITIEKNKLTTVIKIVDIKENVTANIKASLFAAVKTEILTDPSGAQIFIDDKEIGTSNLTAKLSVGSHSIRIVKEYYETKAENLVIDENDQTRELSYILVPLKYSINISSRPSNAEVYFEGRLKGTTPLTIEATKGVHNFKIKHKRYFTRSFPKSVDASDETKIKKVLYPKNLYNFNVMYGINSFGIGLGLTISYFSISCDIFPKIKTDVFTTSKPIMYPDTKLSYNSEFTSLTDEKISISDSSGIGWDIKAGFVLLQPFMMRIHVGYGYRGVFRYNEVYRMIKDAIVQGTNIELKEGDLVKSSVVGEKSFNSFLVGIEIPIRFLNLGVDYWFNSEKGPGLSSFVFRLGLNLY